MSIRESGRATLMIFVAGLCACSGGDRPSGTDGGVIVVDGARSDGAPRDGSAVDGGATWCSGYTPPAGSDPCTSSATCEGGGGVCYPVGSSCCPVKMKAPRTCEADTDCSGTDVCEEYVPTSGCTFGLGTRCVPACAPGASCEDGTCDSTGHCVPSACPSAWTCPENFDCDAASPGADRHGCVRRGCTDASACDCGECVNGGCNDGPGYCGFACACAAPDTPVATPDGDRAISELRAGDLVYTVENGAVVVAPVALARRRPAPDGHRVLRITLASGRSFRMSAGHPTADGAILHDLLPGDVLGDAEVVRIDDEPYGATHTYDILPASATGAYFAAGALVGSTLHESR
jgi:hypothetical protein